MAQTLESNNSNTLLGTLLSSDSDLMRPLLSAVPLPLRYELEQPGRPIRYAYFVDEGIASVVAVANSKRIEVGLIGREGMSGLAVLLGASRSPHSTYMQVGGRGRRIAVSDLRRAIDRSKTLQSSLLRFAHSFLVQTTHTVVANGCARLEERLARWLLMAHDRHDDDRLPLTHEFLSLMLGVRRAGVTIALNELASRRLIAARRGQITVIDRKGLEAVANSFYGTPEDALRRPGKGS